MDRHVTGRRSGTISHTKHTTAGVTCCLVSSLKKRKQIVERDRAASVWLLGRWLHPLGCAPISIVLGRLSCQPTTQQQTSTGKRSSGSPVPQQAAVSSSSGQRALGLQHHHLRFFQKAPSVVDSNMEPPFLDDNGPHGVFWSWLFLSIIRTIVSKSHKINSQK